MRLNLTARRCSLLLGVLFSVTPAFATDIVQVYRDALGNDQDYLSALAAADALREKGPQGLSVLLPTIGATANTTWNENRYTLNKNPETRKDYNTNGYNVQLTQPLFNWQSFSQ